MTTTMLMEASSPLAAMHQQPLYHGRCGFGPDTIPFGSFEKPSFAPNAFNFRDLSMMGQKERDYFNMPPPVRGSSPTASLAADLSQNMNIDRSSPQYFPTPRRALFNGSGNMFSSFQVPLTTPPVSSSSPAPVSDGMEMSPLPHKPVRAPYHVQIQSPTPDPSPAEPFSDCLTPRSSSPGQVQQLELQLPQERRRSNPLRPSLSRTKAISTTCVPQRLNNEAQLPSFQFGNGIPRSQPASSLNLAEIFEQSSPVAERTLPPVARPVVPLIRPRPSFGLPINNRNASPLGQHSRKLSNGNPLVRPRKQFRRSLSMFEHPDEVMRQEKEPSVPSLPSIADTELPQGPQLPHFISQPTELPRITRETMLDILNGRYDALYEQRVVIDCRFEYEYNGGHINGAVNFNDKEHLASQLFDYEKPGRALLIFHCEYSVHRAPLMAKHVRNKDRMVNEHCYPELTYPEVYVLDGGFSAFYRDHSQHCMGKYIEMDAKEHTDACEVGMGKVKQQQRTKLVRAQTFAFGQHSPALDSSPTAAMCRRGNDDIEMDLDYTPVPARPAFNALQIGRNQRMFSY